MGKGKRRASNTATKAKVTAIEPELIELPDGGRAWYLNGQLHREDGPAAEDADGTREWYLNGELHREDGPAIEDADGTCSWYLNGEAMTESAHAAAVEQLALDRAAGAAATIVIRPGLRSRPSAFADVS